MSSRNSDATERKDEDRTTSAACVCGEINTRHCPVHGQGETTAATNVGSSSASPNEPGASVEASSAATPSPQPYYKDDLVTLYHGDVMDVLPTLGEQVDLVVTDPPYFQPATHYVPPRAANRPIRSLGDTSVLQFAFNAWARELDSLVIDGGSLYIFCDGQSYPIVFNSFYSLGRVRPLIWDKVVSFNGYTWRHQHELIGWVERTAAERVPTGDGDILRARAVPVKDRLHPAEKPAALIARLIKKHAPQLVLDPFAGSGSTLVAAKAQGCRAIGIEIEERYCEVVGSRLGSEEVLSLAV